MVKRRRGRPGTAVKIKGHYVTRGGKRVHIKGHTRKRPKRRRA